jgi:Phosphotransferase enzyme family
VLQPEETRLQWTDLSWRVEAEQWIGARLAELGQALTAPIDQPHVRAWGTVLRVPTHAGTLWFKASIAPLAYEVPLLEALRDHAPGRVPRLVAADAARAWMLLEDAGIRLTDLHPNGTPVVVWKEFLRSYAQVQIDVAPSADALVAGGVPDRRLPHLVDGFLRVLANGRLVRPAGGSALDDDELRRLQALVPALDEVIEVVAALELPDSVQHDDLHPWNVCLRDGAYRFIDWGDACISGPLLSLSVPLAHVGDDAAQEIRDAYLEPWTALRPQAELACACDAAVLLAQITGVLKWELINSALDDDERAGYEDVIPKRLRHLLELACA